MSTNEYIKEERRQSFRLDMEKEPIDITWTDNKGIAHQKKIACLDFSHGGLKVDCDQSIALQLPVTIIFRAADINHQKLYGRTIRCIKQDNGSFEIALRLNESIPKHEQLRVN